MTRADFQRLAGERLTDARALLKARRYSGAYYLAGYAVECALKAYIARRTRRYDFPEKQSKKNPYTHDLTTLIDLAGLKEVLKAATENTHFARNWEAVTQWSEESRYKKTDRVRSVEMVKAVDNESDGILQWVYHGAGRSTAFRPSGTSSFG